VQPALKRSAAAVLLAACSFLPFACGRVHPAAPPAVFPLKAAWTSAVGEFVEGPLVTDGQRLFVVTRSGVVRAFDPATGQVRWQIDERPGTLAAADSGLLLRQVDGTVKSLAPAKGTVRWEAASGIIGDLPPVIDGDRAIVAGKGIAAIEMATGRILWSLPSEPTATAPPVPAGSRLLQGEEDGTLRCRDRATGVSFWAFKTRSALLAPPTFDAERRRVYLGTTDRRIVELDIEKGRLGWAWKVGAGVESPGALHGKHILFSAFDAVLYAFDRGNGNLAWRAPLPSRPLSGPVLSGDTAFVACRESDILGFALKTGKPVGALRTAAPLHTAPLLLGGRLFVGLRDRTVAAFELASLSADAP
jgi:outer membrane protein assembly factor BamB